MHAMHSMQPQVDNFSLHRQALQTKHWAKLGRSNASKAIKDSNQHNHKEHGMARCNLWLHPIRPIGISVTHIPPSAGVAEYQCRVARASAPKVEGNRPRSSKMRNDHENKGGRGASPSNWQDGPHAQTHRVNCQWM